MLSRRALLAGVGGLSCLSSVPSAFAGDGNAVSPALWESWLANIRAMQLNAYRRGWEVEQLEIDRPATIAEIERFESRQALGVPPQLDAIE